MRIQKKSGSLTAAAREFVTYTVALRGVQELSWDKGGILRVNYYNFFKWKRK